MTTTLDPPISIEFVPAPDTSHPPALDVPPTPDSPGERRSTGRDNWTIMILGVAVVALLFSLMAVGFGVRAIDESKRNAHAASVAAAVPLTPAPVALDAVALTDTKVTPSSTDVPSGKYTVRITNTGSTPHELLVFHTDIAAADLPIGPDGKVAEDAPGFKISDGDNLDPGASQSRVIDLSQPGTYLFVCNLPGHFAAGMHTSVIVK